MAAAHAIIHGDRRASNLNWPFADVTVEVITDSPSFPDGFATAAGVDFSQSQEDVNAAIAAGVAAYLSAQTGDTFDPAEVRQIGRAS